MPFTLSVSVFRSICLRLFVMFEFTPKKNEAPQQPCQVHRGGWVWDIGSFGSSERLTGLKRQKWLHRVTGYASKTTDLEENGGVPFLLGLQGLALRQVGFVSNSTWMHLIRGKSEGLIFSHPNYKLIFQEVMKYKNCRSHLFLSSVLILFTLWCLQGIFLPPDSQYQELAVCLQNYLLRRSCVTVRFLQCWFHARMIFQRWAGLISLLGYNRQLLEPGLVLQPLPFSSKQGFRVSAFFLLERVVSIASAMS